MVWTLLILRVSNSKDKCSTATSRTVCYSWHRRWSTAWRLWRVEASSFRTFPFTTLREISSSSENRLVPRLVSLFFLFPCLNLIFIIIILLCSFLVSAKEIRITLKRNVIRQSVPFLRTPAAAFPWEYRPTLKESIRKSHRFWLVCRCVSNPVVDGSSLNRNENDDDSKRKSLSLQSPRISIGATGQM